MFSSNDCIFFLVCSARTAKHCYNSIYDSTIRNTNSTYGNYRSIHTQLGSIFAACCIAWNDAFRKIFQFHYWESVRVNFCSGELDLANIYNLCQWKFLYNMSLSVNFSYDAALLKH